jgi:hypothetical protein
MIFRFKYSIQGFFKHLYKYFVPDEPKQSAPSVQSRGDIVPLYDEHGEFMQCGLVLFQLIYYNTGKVTGYILKPKMRLDSVPSILKEVDVDQECLVSLEEEMFENTDRTGVSGNWQWGLDKGHHQGGWDPSFGVPASWNGKVRAGSESEREVRPNYPTKTFCSFIQFGTDYIIPLYGTNPGPRLRRKA